MLAFRKESLVPDVDEANTESEGSKNRLLRLLDEIESRVERFRRGALLMEEEKDVLFSSIDSIRTSDLMADLLDSKYWAVKTMLTRLPVSSC